MTTGQDREWQLELIPEQLPDVEPIQVHLEELPADQELVGDPPTPEFVESVRKFGVLWPVVLYDKGGHLFVADGRRRVKAAREVGLVTIPAIIVGGANPNVLAIIGNRQRSRNSISDLRAIKALIAQGATIDEIRAATGMKKGEIDAILRLDKLPDPIKQGMQEGTVSAGVAKSALRLSSQGQKELAERLLATGEIHHSDVADIHSVARNTATSQAFQMRADVFAGPTLVNLDAWEGRARVALHQLQAAIPEGKLPPEVAQALAVIRNWLAETKE